MVISQLKNVRSTAKAFTAAQNIAASDLLKWSSKDPNRIIQDVFLQISELNTLWAEVQKEFTGISKIYLYYNYLYYNYLKYTLYSIL